MYLVDTNVISEARKGKKANPGVQRFFQAIEAEDLYLSVQTIGELRRGLENIRHRGDLPQARKLETWLDLVVTSYADRILSFDDECAQVWGRLMSPRHEHPIDKQIAAIALIHDLTVVTRNVDDFHGTGTITSNPFV
ncbi:type II toxin-antitoxin system VapC family toxin [Sulfuritalea sp.]|uniref:type II toxin-antitoxin system VapC family toxin n=1 Tax=Sulfuritalea sp. TaxID=2480090 RepID=UPI001AC6F7F1|nr:type II toxin-antitoxin system VapC family toxin [Sulfuritalea sp.]MBN8475044.1 type II toxin-antitoxin system VapC family toxin [Sulfuritalea sp.]